MIESKQNVLDAEAQICGGDFPAIRRGLHNEGSELLRERLADKIDIDFNTARRLFTLVCVLHIRG